LIKVGKELTDLKEGRYALGINPAWYWLYPFTRAFGGRWYDTKTMEVEIASPESIRGFQFLIDLIYKHRIISDKIDFVNGYSNMTNNFKEGYSAMIIQGPWETSNVLSGREFRDNPDNLGIVPIPRGSHGYGSPIGGNAYVLSKTTKHAKLAYKFINFINSKKAQALYAERNNIIPTRTSVYNVEKVKKNPIIQGFRMQMEVATAREMSEVNSQLQSVIEILVQKAYLNKLSPGDVSRQIEKKWKKIFMKLKKRHAKKH